MVFDALWGYRRDVLEYANKLEKFDGKLGVLLDTLRDDYLFIITANHGNDSTHTGTDHTREKVPFIAYSTSQKKTGELEETDTFAIIGATLQKILELRYQKTQLTTLFEINCYNRIYKER